MSDSWGNDPQSARSGGDTGPSYEDSWYVHGEGEALGPYTGQAMREMIAKGAINRSTLVAKVGAAEWTELGNVPALARASSGDSASGDLSWVQHGGPMAGIASVSPHGAAAPLGDVKYAGFWIRLLAYLLDSVIISASAFVIGFCLGLVLILGLHADLHAKPIDALFNLIGVVIAVIYNIAFPSGGWQATPGKRICGIHIIRVSGERVSGGLAFGRWLSYFLSSLTLCIGFMMIGWNKEKKGLHDIVCGTRVIYGRP
jgi:uncharacterized RDD family membrane protein YckC